MTVTKTGRGGGRPPLELNKEQFEKLCGLQCTIAEIAGFFYCDDDTVQAWCKRTYGEHFSVIFKKYSERGKISLRRSQFKLAEKSAAMAIWLGKQMLGQRDIQVVEQNVAVKEMPPISLAGLSKDELKELTRIAFTERADE